MFLYEKKLQEGIHLNMDLPSKGTFHAKLNAPSGARELSWKLLSLPLYMVFEFKTLIDLGILEGG